MLISDRQLRNIIRQSFLKEGMFDTIKGWFGDSQETIEQQTGYVLTSEDMSKAKDPHNLVKFIGWLSKQSGVAGAKISKERIEMLSTMIINRSDLNNVVRGWVLDGYPSSFRSASNYVKYALPFISDFIENRVGTSGSEWRAAFYSKAHKLPKAMGVTTEQKREALNLYLNNLERIWKKRRNYIQDLVMYFWPDKSIDRNVYGMLNVTVSPGRFLELLRPGELKFLEDRNKRVILNWFSSNLGTGIEWDRANEMIHGRY